MNTVKKTLQFIVDKDGYSEIAGGFTVQGEDRMVIDGKWRNYSRGHHDYRLYKFIRIVSQDGAILIEVGEENHYRNQQISSMSDRKIVKLEEIKKEGTLFNWINDFSKMLNQRAPLDDNSKNHVIKFTKICNPIFGTDTFRLDNGKLLVNKYGKYQPGVTFILPKDTKTSEACYIDNADEVLKEMNVIYRANSVSALRGDFRVSQKGKNVFEVSHKGNHILFRIDWGGAFGKGRGSTTNIEKENMIYHNNAHSNGGGSGYEYIILEKNFRVVYSEEDI